MNMKIFWAIITVLTMFVGLDFSGKEMKVDKVWSRAVAAGAAQANVYLTMENKMGDNDSLDHVTAKIADNAIFANTTVTDGISQEQEIKGISINKDETKVLKPQGVFIKLTGLHKELKVGDSFPITFYFGKGGAIDKSVHVEQPTATMYDNY